MKSEFPGWLFLNSLYYIFLSINIVFIHDKLLASDLDALLGLVV